MGGESYGCGRSVSIGLHFPANYVREAETGLVEVIRVSTAFVRRRLRTSSACNLLTLKPLS